MEDPNYRYEFAMIHYGATLHCQSVFDQIEETPKSASPKTQEWWKNHGKWLWTEVMQNIYSIHSNYHIDAVKSIKDKKLNEKFKQLIQNGHLFQTKEYQYELMLMKIGTAWYARKEALEEFKNLKKNNQ